jgi:hypothetical protein
MQERKGSISFLQQSGAGLPFFPLTCLWQTSQTYINSLMVSLRFIGYFRRGDFSMTGELIQAGGWADPSRALTAISGQDYPLSKIRRFDCKLRRTHRCAA